MLDLLKKIIEATANDIRRKHRSIKRLFPDFDNKTKGVEDKGGLRLVDQDDNTWKFKVHSGTKSDVWYDDFIHFKNVKPTLERMVWDKRLWIADKSRIDLRKLAKEFMNKVDIQLNCSCPADLYWGGQYIRSLGKYDANFTRREIRPPRVRNPKQYGMVCKHLDRLLKALPFYGSTMARWIKDFYGKDIAKWEQETKEKYGWVEPAKKELMRRKEEKPEGEPEEEPKKSEEEPEEPKKPKKAKHEPKRPRREKPSQAEWKPDVGEAPEEEYF